MGKIIFAILLIFSISACTTIGDTKDIIYVDVPILYCPLPQEVKSPILDIDRLTSKDSGDYEKIVKAYASAIVRLKSYASELESQLEIYKGLNNGITNE